MKNLLLFTIILFAINANGQDTLAIQYPINETGNIDVNLLVGAEDALFSALLLLLTFFSYLIPGLKKVQSKHVRALAIGLTLIFVFVVHNATSNEGFNIGQVITYIINYIITTSAYDKIFKPAGIKTPREKANKQVG